MVSSVSNLAFKTTAGQLKTSNYMMTTSFPCPLIPTLWVFVFFEKNINFALAQRWDSLNYSHKGIPSAELQEDYKFPTHNKSCSQNKYILILAHFT